MSQYPIPISQFQITAAEGGMTGLTGPGRDFPVFFFESGFEITDA